MCGMTRSYVWHDSCVRVAWPIHMCGIAHSYVRECDVTRLYECHESFIWRMYESRIHISHSFIWSFAARENNSAMECVAVCCSALNSVGKRRGERNRHRHRDINTHTHIYACTHTYIYACTHTNTHTHIHIHTNMHIHVCKHTHPALTLTHAHEPTHTHTHTHTHTRTQKHTQAHNHTTTQPHNHTTTTQPHNHTTTQSTHRHTYNDALSWTYKPTHIQTYKFVYKSSKRAECLPNKSPGLASYAKKKYALYFERRHIWGSSD